VENRSDWRQEREETRGVGGGRRGGGVRFGGVGGRTNGGEEERGRG